LRKSDQVHADIMELVLVRAGPYFFVSSLSLSRKVDKHDLMLTVECCVQPRMMQTVKQNV